jgi:NAD(P)-dependent dehydrogenase (short-subunit alcohol dehydrogenase family)
MKITTRAALWGARRIAKRKLKKNRGKILMAAGGVGAAVAAGLVVRRLTMADLKGEVVLITGGSRGLGFLLAREFARQGCRVVICARDETELERARFDLERQGADVLAVQCDVTDPSQVERMVEKAKARFGQVDILVNNAGTIQVGPFESMTAQDFEDAMRVMFWGMLYPTLTVLPEMLGRQSGRIVNITSIGGKVSIPHLLPYGCAKFAAVGLSEGLRAELKSGGIRVTTIVPGLMRTGSFLNAFFKGRQEKEFRWFSLGAALPLISMDAKRAARQIVDATRRGQAERVLSLPAGVLALFHGRFPGLTADLLGWANRLVLPGAEGGRVEPVRGMDVRERARSSVFRAFTRMGLNAAERLNQYPGPAAA